MILGALACLRRYRDFRPQVLFSTGGFVSIPATVAAWLTRTPVVMFLPDVGPGKTIRHGMRLARRLTVSVPDSLVYLRRPDTAVVTGYPVRPAFLTLDRTTARTRMALQDGELQLLVMGGSLGAAAINQSIARGLLELLAVARVVHVCGPNHLAEMSKACEGLPSELRDRYRLSSTLDERDMATAMFASDLAITRGGASILGELPAAGLPAIIVPLPADRVGQRANAEALERHNACVIMSNHHASSGELVRNAIELLKASDLRATMARAMSALFRPNASRDIAGVVLEEASPA